METVPTQVDQADLQGNVLAGYGFHHCVYAFARVVDPVAARRWVAEAADRVTTAVPFGASKPAATLNVAFTHEGLAALGVSEPLLVGFPDEFRAGMAARAEALGDVGPSHPHRWEEGLRAGEPQVLVTVATQERAVLADRRSELRAELLGAGLAIVHEQGASVLGGTGGRPAREHFGFADGFAQPSIADPKAGPTPRPGQGTPSKEGWRDLGAGEFVLGYPDEDGVIADGAPEPLARSGSYMVVRKLHQDVALFNRYLLDAAGGDPAGAELLAAKIVGRWRDGTPLALSPDGPDPDIAGDDQRINDFTYGTDRQGLRCPLGAHIRRSNPRDGLGWEGRLTKRHRIVRRGMPYGPPLGGDGLVDDGVPRGLVFVCYQASIARQFEVVQGSWINDGDAFGLGAEKDFLLAEDDPEGKMTIQGAPPTWLTPRPSFVTTRGGGYFFAPGVEALRTLGAER